MKDDLSYKYKKLLNKTPGTVDNTRRFQSLTGPEVISVKFFLQIKSPVIKCYVYKVRVSNLLAAHTDELF